MKRYRLLKELALGDMTAVYLADKAGHVGLTFVPVALADRADPDAHELEPLVQLYIRGDGLPSAYANGLTSSGSSSGYLMKCKDQTVTEEDGVTVVET
ncbi:MAG: hypothetical protein IKZ41_10145, partial [Clostridia bacterium]|nr:hypothetical protein [Clostridia bacterium]